MIRLEHLDLQGSILKPYNMPVARFAFIRIDAPAAGQKFLHGLLPSVTTAEIWDVGKKPDWALNVGFTWLGLKAMGVPGDSLGTFPEEFKEGMAARAHLNRDAGPSAPEHWDPIWTSGKVHVSIAINAQSLDVLESRWRWMGEQLSASGAGEIIGRQDAALLVVGGKPTRTEHFGYVDGFGDPDIAGSGFTPVPGRGKLMPDGSWEPLAAGEFILGYLDEAGELPEAPRPDEFSRNGSFLVYRKLHQNVASFRNFIAEHGRHYEGGPERLAARICGRWRDGTPVEISPMAPEPGLVSNPHGNNNFGYAADPNGNRCPIGAHIRRANPRDSLLSPLLVNRHRIIRRGITYGPWVPLDQPADDAGEHGMLFITLQANICRQFEFVNREWMQYGNEFGLGNDRDLMVGQHAPGESLVIQGNAARFNPEPPLMAANLSRFVVTQGGDYFFVPGISALRLLADGKVTAA